MFAEVESGKSRNVIIVCVCCPEENYIAHRLYNLTKFSIMFHLTQMLLLKLIGTNESTAYMQQVYN